METPRIRAKSLGTRSGIVRQATEVRFQNPRIALTGSCGSLRHTPLAEAEGAAKGLTSEPAPFPPRRDSAFLHVSQRTRRRVAFLNQLGVDQKPWLPAKPLLRGAAPLIAAVVARITLAGSGRTQEVAVARAWSGNSTAGRAVSPYRVRVTDQLLQWFENGKPFRPSRVLRSGSSALRRLCATVLRLWVS